MTQIVFLLAPGVHLLDLAGPAQVFSTAADHGHPYRLRYVAEQENVPTAQGLPVTAATTWPVLDPGDIVLVPGWRWNHPADPDPAADPAAGAMAEAAAGAGAGRYGHLGAGSLRRLADHHAAGGTVASVCAGAFALARAGLLDGRHCTTHHQLQDELARRHPRAHLVRDVLYVTDGRVVTSAGIASGIDLALHLIATRHGPGAAALVARAMVVYARRNGDDHQASAMLRHRSHLSDVVHRVQDRIDARYAQPLPLTDLAGDTGVSERTLTRLFGAATGLTPLRYQQLLRLERAEHLIAQGATTDAAARAVGFTDARMLRRLRARPPVPPRPGHQAPGGRTAAPAAGSPR